MQLKRYPHKLSLKKAMSNYMNWTDVFELLRSKGILVSGFKKSDYAKTGMDFYFSRETYLDLKRRLDGDINYIKSSRFYIPKNQLNHLKECLDSISGKKIDEDDTCVKLIGKADGSWSFQITYNEVKPGMISLLDTTERKIEVNINDHDDVASLDFNIAGTHDHKKVTQLLAKIQEEYKEIKFKLSDIELKKLSKTSRIRLFDEFFQLEDSEWELKKILKLKVNRDNNSNNPTEPPEALNKDLLKGINTALLHGENLIDNEFIKNITKDDFYFTMASMRYDHRDSPDYIDFSIEFKSRPERFEAKITGSGEYEATEKGYTENKKVFPKDRQDHIIFKFQNEFYQIYNFLLSQEKNSISISENEIHFFDETAVSEE
ncbi:hypothetical protein P9D53_03190 [Bacillus haynesii]|uniref:hypothetical protein n=1 Tax=Bacillus haynesii TaxID=1925021 RepID=UPI00228058A7|nr:hypothetical protein [Bacillus haynesii]MCY8542295.1 hypothetical protein [Bacillus haynesii]MEC1357325.1 hypothetical protein [Bacillus haynesii]